MTDRLQWIRLLEVLAGTVLQTHDVGVPGIEPEPASRALEGERP